MMEISRNGRLAAGIGVAAGVLAIAFLARSNGAFDVVTGLGLLVMASLHLYSAWDSRLPVFVADGHGVRMRLGQSWIGLPWLELDEVEHLPRLSRWRDGRIVLLPHEEDAIVAGLGRMGRLQANLTERLYGAPFVVPIGMTTQVSEGGTELASRLADLSGGVTSIVRIDSEEYRRLDLGGSLAEDTVEVPRMARLAATGPEEPLIGPVFTRAREALGLSIDQIAQRARIRADIVEAIERDAFAACGGDFYVRGHLRTLARVLGVDARPLLDEFDLLYADGPLSIMVPEPATGLLGSTGGAMRPAGSGRNWSVLVAAVMSVVLMWSITRMVFGGSAADPTPAIGLSSGSTSARAAVPVTLTATGGPARVVVRDGSGTVVFSGALAFGQSQTISAKPSVKVQSSDGSLTVSVDGSKPIAVGKTGVLGQRIYAGSHD